MATVGVPITLDKPRTMKLTFQELLALESRLGKPVGEIFGDLSKLGMHALQQIMFAALRHEDRKLRFETMATLIQEYMDDGHDVGDLMMSINEVVTQSGFFGKGTPTPDSSTSAAS